MEQSLASDVERLLHSLQPEQPISAREGAVAQLAGLSVSNLRVVSALIAALESDPAFLIRQKAQTSLAAPAHQAILEQHPDLKERATAPVARPRQSGPSLTVSSAADEIPEDMRQERLQKQLFQALTPLGMGCFWISLVFFFLMRDNSALVKEGLIVALSLILVVLGLFIVYRGYSNWRVGKKS